MTLVDEFAAAVQQISVQRLDAPELMPMLLAQACVKVLPVAGAGLSITEELRVPLGSSDDVVARAEKLQTTLGEGPCLVASELAKPLVADLETLATRWPMYHHEIVGATPFRSVASFPLPSSTGLRLGALDLYSTHPLALPFLNVDAVLTDVALPIADILFGAPAVPGEQSSDLPIWLSSAPVTERMHVWVAVGMLIAHADLSNADALAAIRAYAFGHSITVDDVADQMMSRRVVPEQLLR